MTYIRDRKPRNLSKHLTGIGVCVFFLVSCGMFKKSHPKVSESPLMRSAQSQLPATLQKIPPGAEAGYGFKNRTEFANAKAGNPFSFYTWKNDSILTNANEITIPVTEDGKFRALATMQKNADTFEIVDFGAAGLASEIQTWKEKHNEYTFEGMLRVFEKRSDFLISTKNNELFYFPLTSAKMYLSANGKSLKEPSNKSEITQFLKSK